MLVFGLSVSDEETLASVAMPSIEAALAPGDDVIALRGQECIFRAYNRILAAARERPGLEGVVLMHQDVAIADRSLGEKLRGAFRDPDVAAVGPIGGRGAVRGMSWWECAEKLGHVEEDWLPDPSLRGLFEPEEFHVRYRAERGDADMLDGLLIALSPRAVRELAFDESLGPSFHGYDADICLQARARGMRVLVEPIEVVHHNDYSFADREEWVRTAIAFARKWDL